MKTIMRFCLLAGLLSWTIALRGTEPDASAVGKVLLLDNERVLEGEITREGDRFHIRRSMGESWIPAGRTLRLCTDMDEAYRFMRGRANLRDADERIRLARWCQLHRLNAQGLEEAKSAVALRPSSEEAQRLARLLQRLANPPETPATPAASEEEAEPPATTAPVNPTLNMLTTFHNKVQPILMNACARCHVTGNGGDFKLVRPYDDTSLGGRTTQRNLAAVVAQINLENWSASPLLAKAITVHGGMGQPALTGRQETAFRTIESWVRLAVEESPRSETQTAPPAASAARVEARTTPEHAGFHSESPVPEKDKQAAKPTDKPAADKPVSAEKKDTPWWERERTENRPSELDPARPEVATPEAAKPESAEGKPESAKPVSEQPKPAAEQPRTAPTTSTPAPPAEPADPFDPLIFNRQNGEGQ